MQRLLHGRLLQGRLLQGRASDRSRTGAEPVLLKNLALCRLHVPLQEQECSRAPQSVLDWPPSHQSNISSALHCPAGAGGHGTASRGTAKPVWRGSLAQPLCSAATLHPRQPSRPGAAAEAAHLAGWLAPAAARTGTLAGHMQVLLQLPLAQDRAGSHVVSSMMPGSLVCGSWSCLCASAHVMASARWEARRARRHFAGQATDGLVA